MLRNEIEEVLANWIAQAISPIGQLAEGVEPAAWAAADFLAWWMSQVETAMDEVENALKRLADEVNRLESYDAGEQLIHAQDAVADLRALYGIDSMETS